MKTRLLLLLISVCFCLPVKAQLLWDKTYGTANSNQGLTRMITLANGGYLLVGNQHIPNAGNKQTSLAIRTNANGDTLWTRKYLPSGWDTGIINDAVEDYGGNLVLVGAGTRVSSNDYNGFILKLNANGDTIWTKKIVTPQSDGCNNVIIGNDSTYILNGWESGDPVIKKVNKNGSTVWSRIVNFSSTVPGLTSNLTKTQGGYFVFSGNRTVFPSLGKIIKLNEAGIEQHSHLNNSSTFADVLTNPNQTLIGCGEWRLYWFGSMGDSLWSKQYKINTKYLLLTSVKATPDGNFISLFDRQNGNDSDVGLIKITPTGAVLKDTVLFRFGYNEYSRDVVVDANGDYVFAGYAQVTGGKTNFFLAKHRKWNHTLGLKEDWELSSGIKIYPNPAIDKVNLTSEKLLTGTLSLYNLQGKQVWQETVAKTTKKVVPLQNIVPGIYFLRFTSENGTQFSRKVIKN